jgi:hypothetical protein
LVLSRLDSGRRLARKTAFLLLLLIIIIIFIFILIIILPSFEALPTQTFPRCGPEDDLLLLILQLLLLTF